MIAGSRRTEVNYDLEDVLAILRAGQNRKLAEPRQIRASVIDHFLFSERFNSVLGLDGFQIFKFKLKEIIARVNEDDFGPNLINLDKLFEALLDSGLYYNEDHLPEELAELAQDARWLTAYRYIAKNFPEITYQDFRVIVNRLKDARGHSFYVQPSDTKELVEMAQRSELFEVVADVKASLLQMNMRQLRDICEREGIASARGLAETADRIIVKCGDRAGDDIPEEYRGRRSLIIKDQELATGDDIIRLDAYLRAIARVVREDLVRFVSRCRHSRWS